jgi:hypothetical protein
MGIPIHYRQSDQRQTRSRITELITPDNQSVSIHRHPITVKGTRNKQKDKGKIKIKIKKRKEI